MKCEHCGTDLNIAEVEDNARTAQVYGIKFRYCALCWEAWGTMQFGWQPGVPASRRVRYVDRTKAWDARKRP